MPAGPQTASRRAGVVRLLRRASLNLVDQVLSAVTNVVLSFLVARAVDATGFGAFSVAFVVFGVLIGVERSLVGQPLNIRFSAAEGEERRTVLGSATGTVLAVAGVGAVAVAGGGVLTGGTLGATLLVLAPLLPGLLIQDTCRLAFFAQGRPHLAVVNDLAWAVLQFAAMAVLLDKGVDRPWPYVLAWGGAATAAAVLGLLQMRVAPAIRGAARWIRGQIDLTGYLLMEYLIGAGSAQGSILLVGAVGSLDDVGSLRAAQVLLGPVGIIAAAISTFALPEVSRRTALGSSVRYRLATGISAFVVVVTLAYAAVLLVIPDSLGTLLLGDTWIGASSVLLPMSLASAMAGACLGPSIVIYAMGQARRTFRLHAFEAPLLIGCMAGGLVLGGTPGAAWGLAVSMTVMVPLWFWQLRVLLSGASTSAAQAKAAGSSAL